MGQEASLPVDGRGVDGIDASLEEQAKAPPSSVNPTIHTQKDSKRNKLNIPHMFQRTAKEHNHDLESFEQREAARAAASGGNIYLRHDSGSEDYSLQKMPSQQADELQMGPTFYQPGMQQRADESSKPEAVRHNPLATMEGHHAAEMSVLMQAQQQSATSMGHPESTSQLPPPHPNASIKKGLFPGRSARGMINSMRNLSIGGALRKQKEINDWEKQWDEDDDDSEDGEAQQQQQHGGMILRPGMDAGHSNSSLLLAVPPPPPALSSHVIPMSTTPPRGGTTPLQQQHVRFPSAPPSPIPATDLLSAPSSPLQEKVGGGLEWDTGIALIPQQLSFEGRKPDVQMFLPVLRVLGKGSFGKVVLVQKREGKERGQLFAMKILKKTHLVKRRQIERTRTERKVLSVVNHPFIMKLHYAFQTPDKLYLVLDYCPGGELFFHLSRFRRFPERVARFYAAELLLAIGHLHKRGIIYRDLKPENVLLDAEGHVKLGDFGLAKAGIQHPYEGATSMCGTPEYMAPEVLGQLGHGFCVDYWGLGMIVYEMMTGLPPWYTTDRAQLFRRLKSAPLDIPSYFSESSASCVTALLERNPRRRLGVTGIRTAMEHDFFRNISWRALYSRRVEAPVRPCEGWKPPDAVREDGPLAPSGSFVHDSSQQFYPDGVIKLDSKTLDTATQNFDAQFTRMPVESEDNGYSSHETPGEDIGLMEDLNEDTFLGFSFDIIKDREIAAASSGSSAQLSVSSRHRTQNYHTPDPQQQS